MAEWFKATDLRPVISDAWVRTPLSAKRLCLNRRDLRSLKEALPRLQRVVFLIKNKHQSKCDAEWFKATVRGPYLRC